MIASKKIQENLPPLHKKDVKEHDYPYVYTLYIMIISIDTAQNIL